MNNIIKLAFISAIALSAVACDNKAPQSDIKVVTPETSNPVPQPPKNSYKVKSPKSKYNLHLLCIAFHIIFRYNRIAKQSKATLCLKNFL